MFFETAGTKILTADGEATAANIPTRVFSIHIISGGTAGVVSLKNNGASGTIYVTETGSINTGKTIYFGTHGMLFPNGCYVDVDANTTSVLLSLRKEV